MFHQRADFLVTGFCADDAVALEHATRVGVDNDDRMVSGIEQDGVGGLRTDAVEGEQLGAELFSRLREHAAERAGISLVKESDKSFEFPSFLAEIAGRPYERFQVSELDLTHGVHGQEAGAAQVGNCFFNVAPIGVLREVCAHDDLKARAGRPPVLRAVAAQQCSVVGGYLILRLERPGDLVIG